MKMKKLLLTLLLVPNLAAKKETKVLLVPNTLAQTKLEQQKQDENFQLEKQKEEDNTKLKLALIAAAVSLVFVLKGKDNEGVTLFEQILAYLWKK